MKNFCQSCGILLSKDPKKGGTEKDGSKSNKYCSFCYEQGKFLSPEIDTPKKMQDFCMIKIKEQGVPKFLAWILTRTIPKLKHWK